MSVPLWRRSLVAYNGYDSGLGNRVRVVLGCRSLADFEGRAFYYVWPTGPKFGPRFADLWDFRAPQVSRTTSRLLAKAFPYEDETLAWVTPEKRRQWLWQIRTGSPIQLPAGARPWRDDFRALTPVPQVADRVVRLYDAEFRDTPFVGVMIRAHAASHQASLATSPAEWFITRMLQMRSEDPDVRFFVSCDVPEVAERVLASVPGSFTQRDKGAYNSIEAVRSSVVDLYLLGASGYILGPHFSSFVHLAEHLAGDRLTFETPASQPDHPVGYREQGLVVDPLKPSVRTFD